MTDLLDAVDDLTLPKPVKVDTDNGPTWATEDPLLEQLQTAISSTMSSGSGAGGSPWTRNVLDSGVLYQATIITNTIGDWCRLAGVKPTRQAPADLRSWYVAYNATHREQATDDFYASQMTAWAHQIRSMVNPPKTVEITAPCPVCGQGTYVNDMGDHVKHPLALVYRPDADNLDTSAKVMCRACETVWNGKGAMEELNEEINDKEAG